MTEQPMQDVLFEVIQGNGGGIGLITLNRPQALNALTHTMCLKIDETLQFWEEDQHIKAVVTQGVGEKAFCAGGDIRSLYDLGKQQRYDEAMQFFNDEYRLNYRISHYSKPYIAFMDGITMGGGMGLSIHGAFRIGTERLSMAMPETGIGFFPDIGGTYFLPRCPDEMGTYLGLTGARINAADALYVNLIDHVVPSYRLPELLNLLVETEFASSDLEIVNELLAKFNTPTEASELYCHRDIIEECFAKDTIEAIMDTLKKHQATWYQQALESLKKKSPLSLKVTLEALRRGVTMDLKHCQQMEFNLCYHFMRDHDFYEGVRALLIDKDKNPQWLPASLDKASKAKVDSYFEKPILAHPTALIHL
jgi:enoyl-CoA hydratase/carnithine racemase